ncbi:unnamed protein product [Oikopleura dioica]|uniref:Surfeit locus protein 2 n=1 Tax=Oikopleura dioica TaxID=34765 RepID=E4X451_OIKDI|nr:unnamed protein product [Oikopleura dioica]
MESPEAVVALHAALSLTADNRIKCALTGHEMVPKRAVVEQHMKGKKFVRLAKEWKAPNPEFEELRAHLVDNKKNAKMLYCNLTGRSIQNEVVHIQRHIFGQKFTKALAHYKECEKTGAKFHSMRSWGSRGKEDKQFYEERGLVDSDEDDEEEAVGSSKRKTGDDDLSDLMPWLRENASEMEPMEAEISGEEEEMEVEATKEVKKMVLDKNSSRKRNKQGSVPVRKKKQQMDID